MRPASAARPRMATGVASVLVVFALVGQAAADSRLIATRGVRPSAGESQSAQPDGSPPWLQNLQLWLKAVQEHTPGQRDMPAILVSQANEVELEAVRLDLLALLSLQRQAIEHPAHATRINYKRQNFTLWGVEALLGLTRAEAAQSDGNRILKRGAILHGDVAMLVVPTQPGQQVGCSAQEVTIFRDGHQVASGCKGIHWVQGRELLDAVRPDPRKDPMVRLWYQATITFLLQRRDYSNGVPQIDHASLMFPDHPRLLFLHGYYHEAFASRDLQPAVRATKMDLRSTSAQLKEAEDLFGRALESSPDFGEARMHRGAVLGALGRHVEAAAELQKAAAVVRNAPASTSTAILRYYTELLLGDEEQALGRKDVARGHYTEASALYPLAQSPWIAVGALARRSADRVEALAAVRSMLSLPVGERDPGDPWWSYYFWLSESANKLLEAVYAPFLAGDAK
jgi:tetratricopeptide (TPR) repeat protein